MKYNPLGRTGLFVSELCLGTMTFGGGDEASGARSATCSRPTPSGSSAQALDAGINFIDTADVYAGGPSEQITGQALKNLKVPREDVVVATKVFGETGAGPNARGATRSHILDGVKASLKRLQLDHIDLYQIHGFDPATPIEETRARARPRWCGRATCATSASPTGRRGRSSRRSASPSGSAWRASRSLQAYYTDRRPRPRARAGADAAERRRRPDGLEPAGRRLAQRQVRPRASRPRPAAGAPSFDFPPVDKERAWDCIDAMREIARRTASRWRRSRSPGCCTSRR